MMLPMDCVDSIAIGTSVFAVGRAIEPGDAAWLAIRLDAGVRYPPDASCTCTNMAVMLSIPPA